MLVLITYTDNGSVIRELIEVKSEELIDSNGVYSEEYLDKCADLGIDPESILSYSVMEDLWNWY